MIHHGWTDYIPGVLFTIICSRGLFKWRQNATKMKNNLEDLRAEGDKLAVLFARTDQLQDNLRAIAFLIGLVLGLMSFTLVAELGFTKNLLFLRLYGDFFQVAIIGAFAVFAFNAEIYGYVLDKMHGER